MDMSPTVFNNETMFRKALFATLVLSQFGFSEPGKKIRVALTYDDLPACGAETPGLSRQEISDRIIKQLKDHKVEKAYGFVNGLVLENQATRYDILQQWKRAGHLIGNHTYSHFDYAKTSFQDFRKDIERNETFLLDFSDSIAELKVLRLPFLQEGETKEKRYELRSYLTRRNYQIAQVTIDFQDWGYHEAFVRCRESKNKTGLAELKSLYLKGAEDNFDNTMNASMNIWGMRDIPHILLLHYNAPTSEWGNELLALYEAKGAVYVPSDSGIRDQFYNEDSVFWGPVGKTYIHQALEARKITTFVRPPLPKERLDAICR